LTALPHLSRISAACRKGRERRHKRSRGKMARRGGGGREWMRGRVGESRIARVASLAQTRDRARDGFRGVQHCAIRHIVDSGTVASCGSVTGQTRSMAALAGDVGGAAGGAGGAAL
jgi:hypothetical protein